MATQYSESFLPWTPSVETQNTQWEEQRFVRFKNDFARLENFPRQKLKGEVEALLQIAGFEGWDGEGALPVTEDLVDIAKKIIGQFPEYVDEPEISATPQGEIDFDWTIDRNAGLSIGVCPQKKIASAWIFHDEEFCKTEDWNGELPSSLQDFWGKIQGWNV